MSVSTAEVSWTGGSFTVTHIVIFDAAMPEGGWDDEDEE
jgi:hypothetical protein